MRDGKPIEEVIYEVVEIVLALLMLVLFLFVLITNGEEPALIDLTFMFGILMNVLAGVFSFYKGQRRLAALPIVLAVLCLVVIIL